MNDLPPTPPVRARPRWLRRGLLLLALASTAWVGWRAYDHRAAIREAQAAGFTWQSENAIDRIRADWRTAFRVDTWTEPTRLIDFGNGRDLARLRPLLLRLRPTDLIAEECRDTNADALRDLSELRILSLPRSPALQNVDALRGLSRLQTLYLYDCPALQSIAGLQSLTRLERLDLRNCPVLQNLEPLRGLIGLRDLNLGQCPIFQDAGVLQKLTNLESLNLSACDALQNVDGLKGLHGLKTLHLLSCDKLPPSTVRELRAAVPETQIFDQGPPL